MMIYLLATTAEQQGEAFGKGLAGLIATAFILVFGLRFVISKLSGSSGTDVMDRDDAGDPMKSPNNDPSREGPPRF